MRGAKAASSKEHPQRRQHRRARGWLFGSQGSVPPGFDPDDESPIPLAARHFPLRRDRGEGEGKASYPAQRREAEHAERRPSLTIPRTHQRLFVLYSDGDILVPRHSPICLWNLVKEDAGMGASYR